MEALMEKEAFVRAAEAKKPTGKRLLAISAAALSSLLILFILFNILIAAPAEDLAYAKVGSSASTILNAAVKEVMDEYSDSIRSDFAKIKQNEDGSSILSIDAVGMNLLAARIVENAQRRIAELSCDGISLPLGSASKIAVFSGKGPNIKIGISPLGEIRSSFSTGFVDAGVNQTRFFASLTMNAEIEMLIFGKTKRITAAINAPICEAIIVGNVPGAYTNVQSLEDALNLIPAEARDWD